MHDRVPNLVSEPETPSRREWNFAIKIQPSGKYTEEGRVRIMMLLGSPLIDLEAKHALLLRHQETVPLFLWLFLR